MASFKSVSRTPVFTLSLTLQISIAVNDVWRSWRKWNTMLLRNDRWLGSLISWLELVFWNRGIRFLFRGWIPTAGRASINGLVNTVIVNSYSLALLGTKMEREKALIHTYYSQEAEKWLEYRSSLYLLVGRSFEVIRSQCTDVWPFSHTFCNQLPHHWNISLALEPVNARPPRENMRPKTYDICERLHNIIRNRTR